MLENRYEIILRKLNDFCPNTLYKIVETGDIGTGSEIALSPQTVQEGIFYLHEQNYIDLKYHSVDGGVYCIAVLEKGRRYCSQTHQTSHPCPRFQVFLPALAAFLGGLVGGVVTALIVVWVG